LPELLQASLSSSVFSFILFIILIADPNGISQKANWISLLLLVIIAINRHILLLFLLLFFFLLLLGEGGIDFSLHYDALFSMELRVLAEDGVVEEEKHVRTPKNKRREWNQNCVRIYKQ